LDAQLAPPSSSSDGGAEQQQQQQQAFSGQDLSLALLATVATLPDLVEDVPKSPALVAELIGHFLAAGQLSFGLQELAVAVKEAGVEQQAAAAAGGDGEEDEQEPPLIDHEKAAPMLLIVANSIKVSSCFSYRGGPGGFLLRGRGAWSFLLRGRRAGRGSQLGHLVWTCLLLL
jgi:hypothetical protein